MSTHCAIIVKYRPGKYRGIYVHFDGYPGPGGVFDHLKQYCRTPREAIRVTMQGDLLSLEPNAARRMAPRPMDAIDWKAARAGKTVDEVLAQIDAAEFVYVFDGKQWEQYTPPQKEKPGAKIRYVYSATRDLGRSLTAKQLEEAIESFDGIKEEAGEYLYGGIRSGETISVEMQVSYDGGDSWQTIYGDPR